MANKLVRAAHPLGCDSAEGRRAGEQANLWVYDPAVAEPPYKQPPFGRARRTNEQPTSVPPLGVQSPN